MYKATELLMKELDNVLVYGLILSCSDLRSLM